MSNRINDVKEVFKTDDIVKVNSLLSSENWILIDTQQVIQSEEFKNDVTELFILGRIT